MSRQRAPRPPRHIEVVIGEQYARWRPSVEDLIQRCVPGVSRQDLTHATEGICALIGLVWARTEDAKQ